MYSARTALLYLRVSENSFLLKLTSLGIVHSQRPEIKRSVHLNLFVGSFRQVEFQV